jgi:hypothetical protein
MLSTGPRSRAGKAKVARNALRHGLAIPVTAVPEFEEPIARLAELLAGTNEAARAGEAYAVAISMVELERIERKKAGLIEEILCNKSERALAALHSLERYERCALSKRKSALRQFQSAG